MLDLSKIGEERRIWVAFSGALAGVDVQVRYCGPQRQERFRQKLISHGILKAKDGAYVLNSGREMDWFVAYAKEFITDWRGAIKLGDQENPDYTPELMATVLAHSKDALEAVSAALEKEADFFSQNGNGSTG